MTGKECQIKDARLGHTDSTIVQGEQELRHLVGDHLRPWEVGVEGSHDLHLSGQCLETPSTRNIPRAVNSKILMGH